MSPRATSQSMSVRTGLGTLSLSPS
ncbi:hypothetical protein LINGRAHAP2_LOCUS26101 [Linum grandiflorum]